jgi:hypothetical protein
VTRLDAQPAGPPRPGPLPRRYRCRIDDVNPISFVPQLPEQGIPPPLPEPAAK